MKKPNFLKLLKQEELKSLDFNKAEYDYFIENCNFTDRQKEIMQNTNNGFDTLHLSNQIEGTRDAVHGISNQICNSTADITGAITNGFYGAEIAAGNRQMANMQQGFNLSTQLADCCCENRLASERLNATILSENCADRAALQEGLRDVITNQTANTQRIIDEIFRDRLDEKDSKIADLQRELQMADLRASQIAQTSAITSKNMLDTLKHELVHVWLYENGHKNQSGKEVFSYEDVCEIAALSNNFVNKIVKLYKENKAT